MLSNQWDSTTAIVFLDFSTLWERMTIQEQWEPLSPNGYSSPSGPRTSERGRDSYRVAGAAAKADRARRTGVATEAAKIDRMAPAVTVARSRRGGSGSGEATNDGRGGGKVEAEAE